MWGLIMFLVILIIGKGCGEFFLIKVFVLVMLFLFVKLGLVRRIMLV